MSGSGDRRVLGEAAYVAVPVGSGPWPGVVVVHDAFGLSDDMREQADWLAAAGYVAVIPDLFKGRAFVRCVKGIFAQLRSQDGPAFVQVDAVRTWLAGIPECTGTVGVIGYCMGGGFALLLAGRPGWSASAVNYGAVPDNAADVLRGGCPLVGSFGGQDRGLRGAADALRRAADAAGVRADVKEYPQARHGFINRVTSVSPLTPMLKVMGVAYDHEASADAKRRILAFFGTYLHDSPGTRPSEP